MIAKEEIHSKLKDMFFEMFGLEKEKITLEALLYEDLDIDSIDAIDLLVRLEELIPEKPSPEEFKKIRKVGDIVNLMHDLMRKKQVDTLTH